MKFFIKDFFSKRDQILNQKKKKKFCAVIHVRLYFFNREWNAELFSGPKNWRTYKTYCIIIVHIKRTTNI